MNPLKWLQMSVWEFSQTALKYSGRDSVSA
jgi:hypothetical protein